MWLFIHAGIKVKEAIDVPKQTPLYLVHFGLVPNLYSIFRAVVLQYRTTLITI